MHDTYQAVCAEALFASTLQASQEPGPDEVREAVTTTLRRFGITGCVARLATEFGDRPEAAARRMRWALTMTQRAPCTSNMAKN
jgi:hypothetical protein